MSNKCCSFKLSIHRRILTHKMKPFQAAQECRRVCLSAIFPHTSHWYASGRTERLYIHYIQKCRSYHSIKPLMMGIV